MLLASETLELSPYTVTLYLGESRELVVYLGSREEGDTVFSGLSHPRPTLAVVDGMDWDRELSPWPAAKVFRGGQDFGGEAQAFLTQLTETLLPAIQARLPWQPESIALAGYSLAGLFAAWAMFQTERFQRFALLSASLWYDDFLSFAQRTPLAVRPQKVYLSLGDGEKRTKNQRMRLVEDNTHAFLELLQGRQVPVELHMEAGGHFNDVTGRVIRGIEGIKAIQG